MAAGWQLRLPGIVAMLALFLSACAGRSGGVSGRAGDQAGQPAVQKTSAVLAVSAELPYRTLADLLAAPSRSPSFTCRGS